MSTQWMLLARTGPLRRLQGSVATATTGLTVAPSSMATTTTTAIAGWLLPRASGLGSLRWPHSKGILRRNYGTPTFSDRRGKRNHFKSNRDHKGGNNQQARGGPKEDRFRGQQSAEGHHNNTTGTRGEANQSRPLFAKRHTGATGTGVSGNGMGSRATAAARKNRTFGSRRPGMGQDDVVSTNKFQNLLSFAFDDGDQESARSSTPPTGGAQSGQSSASRKQWNNRSSGLFNRNKTNSNTNNRRGFPAKGIQAAAAAEEDEDDEDDEDDIFAGTNDLALSALGLEASDDDEDDAAFGPARQKKTRPKSSEDPSKKKVLKKQKKKDGRSLLKNFKFENSIFGDDDDFFGHVDWDERDNVNREERRFKRQQRKKDKERPKIMLPPQEVEIPTRITVKDLAERMCIKSKVLIRAFKDLGESGLTDDSVVTSDIAEVAVESLNMIPVLLPPEFVDVELTVAPEDCSMFPVRPPVLSVMGHVDHGKTTLLDALRKSNVAASEAGGITQGIGAFTVDLGKKFGKLGTMTFIDTPGHAAFSSMRAMGSEVTDMIVLVVAADDGVRPQTEEVIKLAQKNNVPMVIAVTKVDMHAHDQHEVLTRIGNELLNLGVIVEDMGGETPIVCVSGKTGEGLDALKETIALHAEVMDIRANPSVPGEAIVLEAKMARGVGAQVDTIVKWGTLKVGSVVVCGQEYGKVRGLIGADGKRIKQATPGMPVRVIGLKGLPNAGEPLLTVPSEERAKEVVGQREEMLQWDLLAAAEEAEAEATGAAPIHRRRKYMGAFAKSRELELRRRQAEEEAKRIASLKVGEDGYVAKVVPIIVKTDAAGVITAIDDLIASLPTEEAVIKRILGAVGPVSSSDLALAEATGAHIYAFNIKHPASINQEALQKNLSVRQHRVIYSMLDDITELLREHLEGQEEVEVQGTAEVVQEIPITKSGRRMINIAGCRVTSGSMTMSAKYRLVRNGEVIHDDVSMESMRHFQEKVSEVTKGQECGLQLDGITSFVPGDILEAYIVKTVKKL